MSARDELPPGTRVKVAPRYTDFDRPIWTRRETGVVERRGRLRAVVRLDSGPVYTFRFEDLQQISEAPEGAAR